MTKEGWKPGDIKKEISIFYLHDERVVTYLGILFNIIIMLSICSETCEVCLLRHHLYSDWSDLNKSFRPIYIITEDSKIRHR